MQILSKFAELPTAEILISKRVFTHSKLYVVDKKIAISGSANFTYYGSRRNRESITIYTKKSEIDEIENQFDKLWIHATKMNNMSEETRSWRNRMIKGGQERAIQRRDNLVDEIVKECMVLYKSNPNSEMVKGFIDYKLGALSRFSQRKRDFIKSKIYSILQFEHKLELYKKIDTSEF